jgi:hypothetical protein
MKELPIKFSVHKNPLKDKQGNTTYQVRPDTRETVTTKTLKEHREYYNLQDNFTLEGVVEWLKKEMVEQMSFNRRIHLQGIGTFWIKLGLKPIIDENGKKHKRIVTDPNAITGNDLEVTGVNFKPDKEFMANLKRELPYFEHSDQRGSVGHSDDYTEEEMHQSIKEWFAKNDYLTRTQMASFWHLTEYKAKQWLQFLTTGDDALLVCRKQAGTFFYYLKGTSA